jgi:hypothetical protein
MARAVTSGARRRDRGDGRKKPPTPFEAVADTLAQAFHTI